MSGGSRKQGAMRYARRWCQGCTQQRRGVLWVAWQVGDWFSGGWLCERCRQLNLDFDGVIARRVETRRGDSDLRRRTQEAVREKYNGRFSDQGDVD